MSEVGSEFGECSIALGKNEYSKIVDYPFRYVLSGRTGLYMIAEELKATVKKILLPNYCCGTMIAPFSIHGYDVLFYDAFDTDKVIVDNETQAILIMSYFGFMSDKIYNFALRCKSVGKIIIIDATQTAFSHSDLYQLADYIIVSYRKWFDCLCAVVYSKDGFKTSIMACSNNFFNKTWRSAARKKRDYLNGFIKNKKEYLTLYAIANQNLSSDYVGYTADVSEIYIMNNVDSYMLRKSRRDNAEFLIKEVKKLINQYKVQLIFDNIEAEDCPLFLPILVDEGQREVIRNFLITHKIYCPIHWPIDERYPYQTTSYHRRELSLICDQRYGIREMQQQAFMLRQALSM